MKKTYIKYQKDPRPIGPMTMFVHKPIRPDWVNETTYWYDAPSTYFLFLEKNMSKSFLHVLPCISDASALPTGILLR
jgi:hypothetical protein